MRTTWILLVFVIIFQQIQVVVSVKTTKIVGTEGQKFNFKCDYWEGWKNNAKYFGQGEDTDSFGLLIQTDKHNKWEKNGRFSLYDNTTGAFFIIMVDELNLNDSGTYWCGVDINLLPDHISFIHLNVFKAKVMAVFTTGQTRYKLSLQLLLTAVMFLASLVFVCLFSCCLLLTVKHRKSGLSQRTETSSDYEIMMAGVKTKPESCCKGSAPNCPDFSALPSHSDDF